MNSKLKIVSIIIPCRNEKGYIESCLDSIISNDYPEDRLEILIVDGMSDDGTRNVLKRYTEQYSFIKLLDNPREIIPIALNMGIKRASGETIIRMDAHTTYANNYVSKCVEYLKKTSADNVGGVIEHKGDKFIGQAIALAQKCKFGLGGAKFRTAKNEQYVDTVFPGAWPRETFEKYGYFNEKLIRNQDIEHNARIRKRGGKVFLTPEIRFDYYCRSNLKDLWKQNFRNGFWGIKTVNISPGSLSLRHFAPLIFILSIFTVWIIPVLWLSTILSYVFCNMFFSLTITASNGIKYFFILPIVFLTLHISYGLGSIVGVLSMFKRN